VQQLARQSNALLTGSRETCRQLLEGERPPLERTELYEHRQINTCDDLDLFRVQKRQSEIGSRTAEHIGEDQRALPLVELLNDREASSESTSHGSDIAEVSTRFGSIVCAACKSSEARLPWVRTMT